MVRSSHNHHNEANKLVYEKTYTTSTLWDAALNNNNNNNAGSHSHSNNNDRSFDKSSLDDVKETILVKEALPTTTTSTSTRQRAMSSSSHSHGEHKEDDAALVLPTSTGSDSPQRTRTQALLQSHASKEASFVALDADITDDHETTITANDEEADPTIPAVPSFEEYQEHPEQQQEQHQEQDEDQEQQEPPAIPAVPSFESLEEKKEDMATNISEGLGTDEDGMVDDDKPPTEDIMKDTTTAVETSFTSTSTLSTAVADNTSNAATVSDVEQQLLQQLELRMKQEGLDGTSQALEAALPPAILPGNVKVNPRIAELMAKVVAEAAKKELLARKKQSQQQQQQQQEQQQEQQEQQQPKQEEHIIVSAPPSESHFHQEDAMKSKQEQPDLQEPAVMEDESLNTSPKPSYPSSFPSLSPSSSNKSPTIAKAHAILQAKAKQKKQDLSNKPKRDNAKNDPLAKAQAKIQALQRLSQVETRNLLPHDQSLVVSPSNSARSPSTSSASAAPSDEIFLPATPALSAYTHTSSVAETPPTLTTPTAGPVHDNMTAKVENAAADSSSSTPTSSASSASASSSSHRSSGNVSSNPMVVEHVLAMADAMEDHMERMVLGGDACRSTHIKFDTSELQDVTLSGSSTPTRSKKDHKNTADTTTTTTSSSCAPSFVAREWLAKAKSDASTKAKLLIQAAQAEAAARAAARAQQEQEAKARLKQEAEQRLKAKAVHDAWQLEQTQHLMNAQDRAKAKQRAQAKADAEAKLRAKAQADAERMDAMEASRKKAVADIENKLRMKAQEDTDNLLKQEAVALAEAKIRAKAKADNQKLMASKSAKVANSSPKLSPTPHSSSKSTASSSESKTSVTTDSARRFGRGIVQTLSATQVKAKAIARGERSVSPPLNGKPVVKEPAKAFVPFGKSKGEEAENDVSLYLQVPGVVHPSEVKVELEDGVLYTSRGIIVNGVDGVQKFTRSFPFEEELFDTSRIAITLIPANATADGVSVLRFTLPKKPTSWAIPVTEKEAAEEKEESAKADEVDPTTPPRNINGGIGDLPNRSEASLDVPDDEKSSKGDDEPSDEMRQALDISTISSIPDDERAADTPGRESTVSNDSPARDTKSVGGASHTSRSTVAISNTSITGMRTLSLALPTGTTLNDFTAQYNQDRVQIDGKDLQGVAFRHIFFVNSRDVVVRELKGTYEASTASLVIQAPLVAKEQSQSEVDTPASKARRIRVVRLESENDGTGIISLFGDENSVNSKNSHGDPSSSKSKKAGLKGLKSMVSKHLKLGKKKSKHSQQQQDDWILD